MSRELEELQAPELSVDIALVGPSKSGKSALRTQFATETFSPKYIPTLGVDVSARSLERSRLSIWDVAGFEDESAFRPKVLHQMILADLKIFVLVFDLTNVQSLNRLPEYISFCQEKAATAPIILVGNKSDLKVQAVTEIEIQAFIDRNPSIREYKVTSATEASSVRSLFKSLIKYVQPPALPGTQPQERGHGKRQDIIDALEDYIERISAYKNKNGQIDYTRDFWSFSFCGFAPFFSKESRALNRRINFNLAQNFLYDLKHTNKSIAVIFSDVEQRKERYIWAQNLHENPNYVDRSIWGELRSIIRTAQEPEVINERAPLTRHTF